MTAVNTKSSQGMHLKTHSATKKHPTRAKATSMEKYKKQLLEINKVEKNYDRIFEEKLAQEYKQFRELKETHIQLKKYYRTLFIIIIIILAGVLLLTFG